MLWKILLEQLNYLRKAFSRVSTFHWFIICVISFAIRCGDNAGVTSTIRILGLLPSCYPCLLHFYHSDALNLNMLTILWVKLVLQQFTQPLTVNNRRVLLVDGIKVAKEGKKMPGVKLLHQDSDSNSKAEYIMGHSLQAVALLVRAGISYFAVPLTSQIHEGIKFTKNQTSTLLDKMFELIVSLKINFPYYIVADAYYAAGNFAKKLIACRQHLITRVKTNAVAYYPVEENNDKSNKKRGRRKKYGEKVKVYSFFSREDFVSAISPIYGDKNIKILYHSKDLIWRKFGEPVRYIWVIHPTRGKIVIISTDMTLSPLQIIELYGLRFKIEVTFKQSLHTVCAYAYHFWLKCMNPIKKRSGDQDISEASNDYKGKILRKLKAYHVHIQIGLISHGMLQYLSTIHPQTIWKSFGSWIRTIRPGISPSEQVTSTALKNSFPEFLANLSDEVMLKKFIIKNIDFSRSEGKRFAA